MSLAPFLPLLGPPSYDVKRFGNIPVTVVELDQDFCRLRYGTTNEFGTCEADGNPGTECFNTWRTCQDRDNYDKGVKTIRWYKKMQDVPDDYNAYIPALNDVQISPARINAGGQSASSGALGIRGTMAASLTDHPSSDLLLDPYVSTRPYNPVERGSWWTKWLARNPYYQNRPLRVRYGYLGQPLHAMRTRFYVLDAIEGPDAAGNVRLRGMDVLRLVDDDKAQCPAPSPGRLAAAITDTDNSFDVVGATLDDYEAAGTIGIRDELMTYASVAENTPGVLTFSGVTRGTDNTIAEAHDEEDSVQRCVRFVDAAPTDVLRELLAVWARAPLAALDLDGWEAEASVWLPGFELTTLIAKPTGVKTLVAELNEQVQLMLWVDDRDSKVKLMVLRPPFTAPDVLTERDHILQNSASFKQDPDQRISAVYVMFRQHNPVKNLDDEANYAEHRFRPDPTASGPNEYGEDRVKTIHSRWLKSAAQVNDIQQRILGRFRDNPIVGGFDIHPKDAALAHLGRLINVQTRLLTDVHGAQVARQFQIIGAEETLPGERIRIDVQSYDFLASRQARYMADAAPTYAAATEEERATGAWYANDDGFMADGTEGYTYQ